MLQGYRTYIVALLLLLAVAVEKGLGFDVPGVTVADNWLVLILNALGLCGLRAGVAAAEKAGR